MLTSLVAAVSCASLPLHDSDFDDAISQLGRRRFLVGICSRGANLCRDFCDLWEEFAKTERYQDLVTFVDIDCSVNQAACDRFLTTDLPHVAYFNSLTNQTTFLDSSYDSASISDFLERCTLFPMNFVEDQDQVKTAVATFSNFLLRFADVKDERFEMVRSAASRVYDGNGTFYGMASDVWDLTAYRSDNISISFQGEWNFEAVEGFICGSLFPVLSELTDQVRSDLQQLDMPCLLAFVSNDYLLSNLESLAKSVRSQFPVCYLKFSKHASLVVELGIRESGLPQFALFRAGPGRWVRYDDEPTPAGLSAWLKGINLETLSWKGDPETGGAPPHPAVWVVAAVAAVYGVVKSWRQKQKPQGTKRGSKAKKANKGFGKPDANAYDYQLI
jgi:hypothetical protein